MLNGIRIATLSLLLVLIVVACSEAEPDAVAGVSVGSRAHDFSLESLDGETVSLSDLEGNVVLVNFWATWCPPCQAEIPDFEEAYRERGGDGLVVLGVNVEEPASQVLPFVTDMGMTYPVLLDRDGRISREYRALGLPTSLLVDRDGVIRFRQDGILTASELAWHLADLMPDR
jgi:cytochrome c biogenesis protein CcmG/thiol:disulfide interchange protein DsbE